MAASVTFTFVPGTDAEATELNQNFTDLVNFLNGLGIGNLTIPISIANGGTGGQTVAQALANLGLTAAAGITAIPVPINKGGTNATTVAAAVDNLGLTVPAEINSLPLGIPLGGTHADNAVDALDNLGAAPAADFGHSFTTPGQQLITGGFIMKFGVNNLPPSGANTTSIAIAFAQAFPTQLLGVIALPRGLANSGTGGQPTVGTRSESAGGFTAFGDTLGFATFNQTVGFYWFAWGF